MKVFAIFYLFLHLFHMFYKHFSSVFKPFYWKRNTRKKKQTTKFKETIEETFIQQPSNSNFTSLPSASTYERFELLHQPGRVLNTHIFRLDDYDVAALTSCVCCYRKALEHKICLHHHHSAISNTYIHAAHTFTHI